MSAALPGSSARFRARRWCAATLVLLLCIATCSALAQPMVGGIGVAPASPLVAGQAATFTAQASGEGLEYRWDFGDGSPRTPWTPDPAAAHAYDTPGVYGVLVQVRDASMQLASATASVAVRLPAGLPSRHSASILVHPLRREVWSVNPDHGSVSVFDADALVRLAEIAVGAHPASLAVDGDGKVWVAVRNGDLLQRIDAGTRAIDASVPLGYGARPSAVVIGPDGTTGYVALAGPGRVQRFVAPGATLDAVLDVGPHPEALSLRGDHGALFVTRMVSGLDAGTVWRVALPAFDAAEPIALPLDATSPDSGTAARGVPNYVATLALAEDGTSLWYGAKTDNVLRGLHRDGLPLNFETVLRALVGRIDAGSAVEDTGARIDIDDSGRVSALLLGPGASHLFAAQDGNNLVQVLDPWHGRRLASIGTDRAPQGLALDATTQRLFVREFLSRSVAVFDVAGLLAGGAAPASPVARLPASDAEPLDPEVLRGKRVFYNAADARMAQDGYIACAGCHLDGRQDGRTWDFTQLGEGMRNTTSLRGGAGLGRGLVHWSGNFDEIQDFEVPIRNLFGGLGFLDDAVYGAGDRAQPLGAPKAGFDADLDALAAYVASLDVDDRSPWRAPAGALTADGAAGRVLFEQLDCHRCHAGEAYTDSERGYRHDVGTLHPGSGARLGGALVALDTPTLRGLFDSAPYLHDGSALALVDVLVGRNATGAHGDVAGLDATGLQQLLAFLLQIDASEPGVAAAAELAIGSPLEGARYGPGHPVDLAIATDLPAIERVDYLVGGAVVAAANAAPWSAQWIADGRGRVELHAHVVHDGGRFTSLSPPVVIEAAGAAVFADSFESP